MDYYSREVVPAVATAMIIDDAFPVEVLNEIRSAFTHLARANRIGPADPKHDYELHAALRHLRRVCLDCMKVSIFVTARRTENAIGALEEEWQLPADVHKTMSGLRDRRMRLAAFEGQYPTDTVIEKLKILFNDYDLFYQSLDDQFAGKTADDRRRAKKQRLRRQNMVSGAIGIGVGIATGLLTSWLYDWIT